MSNIKLHLKDGSIQEIHPFGWVTILNNYGWEGFHDDASHLVEAKVEIDSELLLLEEAVSRYREQGEFLFQGVKHILPFGRAV